MICIKLDQTIKKTLWLPTWRNKDIYNLNFGLLRFFKGFLNLKNTGFVPALRMTGTRDYIHVSIYLRKKCNVYYVLNEYNMIENKLMNCQ